MINIKKTTPILNNTITTITNNGVINICKRTFSSTSILLNKKYQSKLSEPFNYENDFEYSLNEPFKFWDDVSTKYVHWDKKYDKVWSGNENNPEWFKGGLINACYNALDVHVKDPITRDRIALIHETPSKDNCNKLTYGELWDQVCELARVLENLGVVKGDRVVIYMPMINQALISMLACARLGALHSVVFGGFASPQLAQRIEHSQPKVVIGANFGVEGMKINHYTPLLEKALDLSSHKPDHVVVYSRKDIQLDSKLVGPLKLAGSLDWSELVSAVSSPKRDYEKVDSTHPLYMLYTSGTTAQPKAIVRETGGHVVALNYTMRQCYGLKEGETFFAGSDIGWVVGHTCSVYGPLICGMTSIILEGKPTIPDAGTYWKLIEKHNVSALFSAPTAVRAIHRDDPDGMLASKYNLNSLRSIWLGGERLDSATLKYLQNITGNKPILDNYWQSESGWPMITNPSAQLPIKVNATGKSVPGYDFRILSPDQKEMKPDEIGEVVIKLPVPPSFVQTLYKNPEGYKKAYLDEYPGFLRTGDSGLKDSDGYIHIISRVDDIINVSGHRLSTGSIEEVLITHPKIVECAVIGVNDEIKGEIPFGLIVIKPQYKHLNQEIEQELIKQIRDTIGPIATFKKVISVNRLPKTRSGKILRVILRKMYNKEEYVVPPTIEDMDVIKEIDTEFENYKSTIN